MSQQFLLPCTCGQTVRVANAQAGGQVACGCGKTLPVPTLRGLRELKPAPPLASGPSPRGWSPVHGLVFSSGLVIAAVGVALLAWYGLLYSQRVGFGLTRDHTDEVIRAEQARIDRLSPLDALKEWTEDIEHGLGDPDPPPWIAHQKMAASYLTWIKTGAVSLVTGVLLATATLFLGRRPARSTA
jgi:hypothetical protein